MSCLFPSLLSVTSGKRKASLWCLSVSECFPVSRHLEVSIGRLYKTEQIHQTAFFTLNYYRKACSIGISRSCLQAVVCDWLFVGQARRPWKSRRSWRRHWRWKWKTLASASPRSRPNWSQSLNSSVKPRSACLRLHIMFLHLSNYISLLVNRGWLDSRMVSVLDSGTEGPGFKLQPQCCR